MGPSEKSILLGNEMLAAEHTLCVAAFIFFIGPSSVKVVTSCHHPNFVMGEGLVVEPFCEAWGYWRIALPASYFNGGC